jgi:hypothetical protein
VAMVSTLLGRALTSGLLKLEDWAAVRKVSSG